MVGTKALINVMMKYGRADMLYTMANKRIFPGWGYWIDELVANTLFQNWDGTQSRKHIMFDSIGDFFYKGLGGIQVADEYFGFKQFIIRALFKNDLEWVDAVYNSSYGWIGSHWKKEGENILLELEVPANSQAEVRLPAEMVSKLKWNGKETLMSKHSDKAGVYMAMVLDSGSHLLKF